MSSETATALLRILEEMPPYGQRFASIDRPYLISAAERRDMIIVLGDYIAMVDRVISRFDKIASRFDKIAHQMAALSVEIETTGRAIRIHVPGVVEGEYGEDPTR